MKRGRKRNPNAIRDKKGKSRGEGVHPEVIARRERELEALGIPLTYLKAEGSGVVERKMALNSLAGFTLGQMFLKHQANPKDPYGVSEDQYHAGEKWAALVRWHSNIMDYELKRSISANVWTNVGGRSLTKEPAQATIEYVRARFKDCYNAMVSRGWATADLVYSVCIDNIPLVGLSERQMVVLRCGLDALIVAFDKKVSEITKKPELACGEIV